jgi:hypothetical protein
MDTRCIQMDFVFQDFNIAVGYPALVELKVGLLPRVSGTDKTLQNYAVGGQSKSSTTEHRSRTPAKRRNVMLQQFQPTGRRRLHGRFARRLLGGCHAWFLPGLNLGRNSHKAPKPWKRPQGQVQSTHFRGKWAVARRVVTVSMKDE